MNNPDVIVVVKEHAATCAAISAHDQSAKVAILEAATRDEGSGPFRFNDPRDTGLLSGAVFGKLTGVAASLAATRN